MTKPFFPAVRLPDPHAAPPELPVPAETPSRESPSPSFLGRLGNAAYSLLPLQTRLRNAVMRYKRDEVAEHLDNGADPNKVLRLAVERSVDNLDILKQLLARPNADPNHGDAADLAYKKGRFPGYARNVEAFKVFIEHPKFVPGQLKNSDARLEAVRRPIVRSLEEDRLAEVAAYQREPIALVVPPSTDPVSRTNDTTVAPVIHSGHTFAARSDANVIGIFSAQIKGVRRLRSDELCQLKDAVRIGKGEFMSPDLQGKARFLDQIASDLERDRHLLTQDDHQKMCRIVQDLKAETADAQEFFKKGYTPGHDEARSRHLLVALGELSAGQPEAQLRAEMKAAFGPGFSQLETALSGGRFAADFPGDAQFLRLIDETPPQERAQCIAGMLQLAGNKRLDGDGLEIIDDLVERAMALSRDMRGVDPVAMRQVASTLAQLNFDRAVHSELAGQVRELGRRHPDLPMPAMPAPAMIARPRLP